VLILKQTIHLSLISAALLLGSSAWAKQEAVNDCPRVPSIHLKEAIELASVELKEKQILEDLFPDSAVLKCESGVQVWEIGWRRKAYESGHMIMQVFGDRAVKHGKVVKDG